VYVKCIAALIYTCAGEKMTVAVLIMLVISVGSTAAFPFNGKYCLELRRLGLRHLTIHFYCQKAL